MANGVSVGPYKERRDRLISYMLHEEAKDALRLKTQVLASLGNHEAAVKALQEYYDMCFGSETPEEVVARNSEKRKILESEAMKTYEVREVDLFSREDG